MGFEPLRNNRGEYCESMGRNTNRVPTNENGRKSRRNNHEGYNKAKFGINKRFLNKKVLNG